MTGVTAELAHGSQEPRANGLTGVSVNHEMVSGNVEAGGDTETAAWGASESLLGGVVHIEGWFGDCQLVLVWLCSNR